MLIKTQIKNVLYDKGRPWVGRKKDKAPLGFYSMKIHLLINLEIINIIGRWVGKQLNQTNQAALWSCPSILVFLGAWRGCGSSGLPQHKLALNAHTINSVQRCLRSSVPALWNRRCVHTHRCECTDILFLDTHKSPSYWRQIDFKNPSPAKTAKPAQNPLCLGQA